MHPLYMDDSYLREFKAAVEEINTNIAVLSNTAFYPSGGGVPCDLGWIFKGEKKFDVIGVTKPGGKISHHLANPDHDLSVGDSIVGLVDWPRRYLLMRHHTSAHLLAAIMYNELGVLITGNQLNTDKSRMDFSMDNFDRTLIEKVFKKANEEIQKDRPVKIYFLSRGEADKIPGIVKLANAMPPDLQELRIVEIENIDIQADGGCHVRSLKEIGQIEFVRAENKGKSNRRIYYAVK